ncbi:hypothetical protein LTS08_008652 [Lithohypha guttulata]|nr:hypothetical protein LTS08_008652 [Lithohypha guttulata]
MSNEKPLPASPPRTKPPSRRNTQEKSAQEPTLQSKLAQNYGFSEQDQPTHPPRRVNSQRSLHHVRSLASMRSSQHTRTDKETLPLPSVATTTQAPASTITNDDIERGHEETPFDEEPPWGPSHPCFPHLNPHVPLHSPVYTSTRIIRIRRDWMIVGDLAPTFSNIYPEILDPLLPEQEFRYIVQHINTTLIHAYNPFGVGNWIDGWFWEDLRPGGIKGRLKKLEAWMEDWNRTVGSVDAVKLISLRRTGYLCLDIQIPDPQVRVISSEAEERERERTPTSSVAATSRKSVK